MHQSTHNYFQSSRLFLTVGRLRQSSSRIVGASTWSAAMFRWVVPTLGVHFLGHLAWTWNSTFPVTLGASDLTNGRTRLFHFLTPSPTTTAEGRQKIIIQTHRLPEQSTPVQAANVPLTFNVSSPLHRSVMIFPIWRAYERAAPNYLSRELKQRDPSVDESSVGRDVAEWTRVASGGRERTYATLWYHVRASRRTVWRRGNDSRTVRVNEKKSREKKTPSITVRRTASSRSVRDDDGVPLRHARGGVDDGKARRDDDDDDDNNGRAYVRVSSAGHVRGDIILTRRERRGENRSASRRASSSSLHGARADLCGGLRRRIDRAHDETEAAGVSLVR